MSHTVPPSSARVREARLPGPVPCYAHPRWLDELPWLIQGITAAAGGATPFDLGLFTTTPTERVQHHWETLRTALGVGAAVHARQLHGSGVRTHAELPPGLLVANPCDGHLTRAPGLLLTVAVADCVPVTLVDSVSRTVAVLHAGWRGVVAGVIEAGVAGFSQRFGIGGAALAAHLGPAICGACYEVGPEVHRALGEPEPPGARPIDLRRVVAGRLVRAGLEATRITVSEWCTRCGDSPFFSHRGGDAQRQVAFVGIRADTP